MEDMSLSYAIPHDGDNGSQILSSFAPSEGDSSTLLDLKKRVKELDGMINDMDDAQSEIYTDNEDDDEVDLTNDQLLYWASRYNNTYKMEHKTQDDSGMVVDAGIVLPRDDARSDVYSEFSEQTEDTKQREHSRQLLRQELDAVDMVHSLSGMYWKNYMIDPNHRETPTVANEQQPPGDTSNTDSLNDMERQIANEPTLHTRNLSRRESTSSFKRNRRILYAQILCGVVTILVLTGLALVIVYIESEARSSEEFIPTIAPRPSPTHTQNPVPSDKVTSQPTTRLPWWPAPSAMIPTALPEPMTGAPTAAPTSIPTIASTTAAPQTVGTGAPTTQIPTAVVPTTAPSRSPHNNELPPISNPTADEGRRNQIIRFLEDTYHVDFSNPVNAANMAVTWLLDETIIGMTLDERLAQRFALVALEFSLTTVSTTRRLMQLSLSTKNQNECLWAGVHCDNYERVDQLRWNGLRLFGSISPDVSILSHLTYLDISNNDIAGIIPDNLYQLGNLEHLFLYGNDLSGTLSSRLGDLAKLETLHLSHNRLSGSIPESMDSMYRLRYLNLYRNQLTGGIPSDWKQLAELFYVDLGYNHLSGALPRDWKEKKKNLRHLHLDHNQFSGELPSDFITKLGNNGNLQALTLNHNLLEGAVPSSDRSSLVSYTVHENNFSEDLSLDTCEMSLFASGNVIEFKADCDICACDDVFCGNCAA